LLKPKHIVVSVQCRAKLGVAKVQSLFDLKGLAPHTPTESWEEIVDDMLPHGVDMLTSSIFASWKPMQRHNVEMQLMLVRQSPYYRHFIVNALRIKTLQPRHKTHAVMINLKMGLGLGQIVALFPYHRVLTLPEVKDILQERIPAAEAMLHWLNLETHPELLRAQAQQQDPNIVRLPILFDIQSAITMKPILFRIPNNVVHNAISQSMADDKAHEYFAELAKIEFPTVPSPDLH
jgi:hypothetical protein